MADDITSDGSVYHHLRSRTARKKKLDLNLTKDLDPIASRKEIQRTKNMS